MMKDATVLKWRARVKAQERSGLTQKAWCEREGLALSSLALWRQRFRVETEVGVGLGDDAGQALVPIVVREPVVPDLMGTQTASNTILIESGSLRLRVAIGTDARWLGAVLRELRS